MKLFGNIATGLEGDVVLNFFFSFFFFFVSSGCHFIQASRLILAIIV